MTTIIVSYLQYLDLKDNIITQYRIVEGIVFFTPDGQKYFVYEPYPHFDTECYSQDYNIAPKHNSDTVVSCGIQVQPSIPTIDNDTISSFDQKVSESLDYVKTIFPNKQKRDYFYRRMASIMTSHKQAAEEHNKHKENNNHGQSGDQEQDQQQSYIDLRLEVIQCLHDFPESYAYNHYCQWDTHEKLSLKEFRRLRLQQ